jgi:hypothetical protein
LRLPQSGWPGYSIYFSQEQGIPVIPPGTGLIFQIFKTLKAVAVAIRVVTSYSLVSKHQHFGGTIAFSFVMVKECRFLDCNAVWLRQNPDVSEEYLASIFRVEV